MDGLVMILLLAIGAVGGYCFAALMFSADKPAPKPPLYRPWSVGDTDTVYRRAQRDWDNR